MTAELGEDWENYTLDATLYAQAKDKAQTAVYDFYYAEDQVESRSFLWIKNVFVPDGWQKAVPDYLTVTGQQGMATSRISGVQADEYEAVMGKVLGTGGWGKEGKWNGFLVLPILSLALSVVSQKLMTAAQGTAEKKEKKTLKQRLEKLKNFGKPAEQATANQDKKQADQQQASMKMMQYMMPLITAVFAFMYSSAFALYMLVSSLTATIFQLAFNLIFKIVDKQKERKSATAK
jgi:membrane protein insertase Oxa1/YidC/SpoIIIJ